jgi:hypothetical protein
MSAPLALPSQAAAAPAATLVVVIVFRLWHTFRARREARPIGGTDMSENARYEAGEFESDVYQAVVNFVAAQTRVKPEQITPGTRIGGDLHVDGDDAFELFERFFERFRVDGSAFEFSRHFSGEGVPLWFPVLVPVLLVVLVVRAVAALIRGSHLQDSSDITVADLVEAAELRRWPGERFATDRNN